MGVVPACRWLPVGRKHFVTELTGSRVQRAVPALLALLLESAGCIADGPASPSDRPTDSPTGTALEPVEYAVSPGAVPGEFASLTVTFRVLFVENGDEIGPCSPDIIRGPYKPTPTPLRQPEGECAKSEPVTVDLTAVDGERSLGTFTSPAWTSGHALLVTDVTATLENGTTVTSIKGTGGARVFTSTEAPTDDRYTARIGVEAADADVRYDYSLVWT